jgi:DNA-directed RNA polymerase specialized sigma54-like protein
MMTATCAGKSRAIIDDLAFRQNVDTDEEEIEKILLQIQQFDPPGVGARNLQECLLLQLERKSDSSKSVEIAIKVLISILMSLQRSITKKFSVRLT